jgi:chromosome segregation ATPase
MEDVAFNVVANGVASVSTMSEAEYLRWVIGGFVAMVAAMAAVIGRLIVNAQRSDFDKLTEHIDEQAEEAKDWRTEAKSWRVETSAKIDQRDAALVKQLDQRDAMINLRLDAVQKAQEDARQTQFEEVLALRDICAQLDRRVNELSVQFDKRIDRLEQEDMRRSKQSRIGDK